jgi:hypothetical protein
MPDFDGVAELAAPDGHLTCAGRIPDAHALVSAPMSSGDTGAFRGKVFAILEIATPRVFPTAGEPGLEAESGQQDLDLVLQLRAVAQDARHPEEAL